MPSVCTAQGEKEAESHIEQKYRVAGIESIRYFDRVEDIPCGTLPRGCTPRWYEKSSEQ